MPGALPSVLLAALAALALVGGAVLPVLRTRFFEHRLSLLIGFSAGLMLATALHELLPEALASDHHRAMWGAGAGFLGLYLAERLTHFHACRHRQCEVEDEAAPWGPGSLDGQVALGEPDRHPAHAAPSPTLGHIHTVAYTAPAPPATPSAVREHSPGHTHAQSHTHAHADSMALVDMSLHNFADGLTTAAAFALSRSVGVVVVLAIVLHQGAAGLSLGAIMMRAGRRRRHIVLATSVVASFILWGALFYHYAVPAGNSVRGIILGLAGGSFLYVAACDLLPEAHAEDEGWTVTAMTLSGYLFALGVQFGFGG